MLPSPRTVVTGPKISIGPTLRFTTTENAFAPEIDAFQADQRTKPTPKDQPVKVFKDPCLAEEEYRLELGPTIVLKASTPTGVAWGLQTLGQLMGHNLNCRVIQDKPEVGFRCLELDVARRYHSLSTLRVLIRWCQASKVRYVQLHLTDDQNWMFPTAVLKGADSHNQTHRSAYTLAELTELQQFASARGVTLIPEVDMPGHSELAAKVNPALFHIEGSQSSNCLNFASPEVRSTLKALIQEVADAFPNSPYIHIGGDEAWYPSAESNPYFKTQMAKLGPKSTPEDVFVDFIGEMSDEVIRLGRTPLVWEGFASSPFARQRISKKTQVIAWEGIYYPAKKLLPDGFTVINAGWDPYYIVNHFPYDVYTLVPLETLYKSSYLNFSIVADSTNKDTHFTFQDPKKVAGAMLCWWEGREWNAQWVLPPRISAFGARLWNPRAEKDYKTFLSRYDDWYTATSFRSFPFVLLTGEPHNDSPTDRFTVIFDAKNPTMQFSVRLDDQPPTSRDVIVWVVLEVLSGKTLSVQAYQDGKAVGEVQRVHFDRRARVPNLATNRKVTATGDSDPQFPAQSVTGDTTDSPGAGWLAYPNPQFLTIDLGSIKTISRIEVVACWASQGASHYRLSVSTDNKHFELVVDHSKSAEPTTQAGFVHRFAPIKARYVRLETLGADLYPSTMMRIHQIRVFDDTKK